MAVITGTEGNDFIVSFNGLAQDTVFGLAGNDTLEADQSDFLDGGPGDDRLRARNDSTLLGGEGNDTLLGFGIYDATLDGGAGDDLIDPRIGGGYRSLILGGSGNDTLLLAGWDQTIDAGDGTDVIDLGASEGSASVTSGTGADIIKLGFWLAPTTITDFDLATGGDRIDLLGLYLELRSDYGFDMCDPFAEGWLQLVQDGDDTLLQVSLQGDGSGWIPLVKFQNLVATELDREIHFGIPQGGAAVSITGTSSSETFDEFTPYNGLVPGMLADTINGLGGADLISGGLGGADLLIGGNGIDNLFGFAGNDTLYGGQPGSTLSTHADFISGGGGDDLIYGSSGHDGEFDFTYQGFRYIGGLNGDGGNDTIYGGAGNDIAGGGDGDDSLFGEAGNDIIGGGAGADYLDGGEGDDNITGSVGLDDMAVDTVLGGVGNDTLWGESLDLLDGGEGNDQLNINGDSATAFGGLGNDSLASQKASLLDGGDGDDMLLCYRDGTMLGGNGADWLRTNGGVPYANFLDGGTGDDTMEGGRGDDTYVIDSAGDIITEYMNGGEDTVITALAMTLGSELEHLLLTGSADLNATGNTKDNHLTGNDGNNLIDGLEGNDTLGGGAGDDALNGGAGNDTLTGGAGTDTLIGGAGNDTYAPYASDDVVVELADEGIDTLLVTRSAELSGALSHIENIQLMGKGDFSATGNDAANLLQGNTGANLLAGLAGNDTLRGGGGFDTFVGGAGDDFFIAQGPGFEVIEHDGEGADTLSVRFTATLSANLEKLVLGGRAAIDGTGNASRNVLLGNDAANTLAGMDGDDLLNARAGDDALDGGLGNDTLDGGAGADTAMGGLGDDLYYVGEDGDVVVELADEGFDVVISTVSMSLMANVEVLRFIGWNDAEGFGNDDANLIAGNNSFNRLEGGAGNDTLSGNGLDDTLIGGAGDDLMRGGSGTDVYYVDSVGDRVIESVDYEDDLVISTVSWTLGNHFENLTLSGSADLVGTGNKLHNVLTGNSGNNLLSGGKGMDTLAGGAGVDTLVGGSGFDVFVIHRSDVESGDVDIIVDMASGVDALQLIGFGLGEDVYSSWLAEEAFIIGDEAQTAEHRVVYDEALGSLYYDADGNGSGQAILVASLGNGAELQYYDIRFLD